MEYEEGSQTEIEISLSTGGSDKDTVTYEGALDLLLHFNNDYSELVGVEFTGGRVSVSDITLSVTSDVHYDGFGTSETVLDYDTEGIEMTVSSSGIAGFIGDGVLDNRPHFFTADNGWQEVTISVPSIPLNQSVRQNFFIRKERLPMEEPIGFTSRIVSEEEGIKVIEYTSELEVNQAIVDTIDDTNLTLSVSEKGTVTLKGRIEIDVNLPVFTGYKSFHRPVRFSNFYETITLEKEYDSIELLEAPEGFIFEAERSRIIWEDAPYGKSTARFRASNVFGETIQEYHFHVYDTFADIGGGQMESTPDYLFFGDPGFYASKVRIFDRRTGEFVSELNSNRCFGSDLRAVGDLVLIGSSDDETRAKFSGAAFLYEISTGRELQKFIADDQGQESLVGSKVQIAGNFALISAPGDSSYRGAVYVFDIFTGHQVAKFVASDKEAKALQRFGIDVSVSGNLVLVGTRPLYPSPTAIGGAYVFSLETMAEVRKIDPPTMEPGDLFGSKIWLTEDRAFVGASSSDYVSQDGGAVYVYDSKTWELLETLVAKDTGYGDFFGAEIEVEGNLLAVGATGKAAVRGLGSSRRGKGAVYLFDVESLEEISQFRSNDQADSGIGGEIELTDEGVFVAVRRSDSASGTKHVYQFELPAEFEPSSYEQLVREHYSDSLWPADYRPEADPYHRGVETGLAYGLGLPLAGGFSADHRKSLPEMVRANTPDKPGFEFLLPENVPGDVVYRIWGTNDLTIPRDEWVEIATKVGFGPWWGEAEIVSRLGEGGQKVSVSSESFGETGESAYFQLEVEIAE